MRLADLAGADPLGASGIRLVEPVCRTKPDTERLHRILSGRATAQASGTEIAREPCRVRGDGVTGTGQGKPQRPQSSGPKRGICAVPPGPGLPVPGAVIRPGGEP